MIDNSAWHITKSQNARRKASVQNKPYCLFKKFRHSNHRYQLMMGMLLKSEFPDAGADLVRCYQSRAVRPAMFILFCTVTVAYFPIFFVVLKYIKHNF